MKLKPTQWIGVAAIILFGGGMIFRLTQPSEREIMERRIASLPTISVPAPTFPVPDLSAVVIPTAPVLSTGGPAGSADPGATSDIKYIEVGSQAARDDLYCAGVVSAEFDAKVKTEHPDMVAPLIDAQKRLDSAGIAKLRAEGVSNGDDWAGFTLAYAAQVAEDYKAGKLRLPVAACVERAAKLPPGDLY
jgi:hypothetical protein